MILVIAIAINSILINRLKLNLWKSLY
jgi:hypothetical protein